MTDTPKALSAEEEAVQRFLSAAKKTTRWNLMADDHSLVAFYSHTQHDKTGASPNDIARALDAARAEADRLRAELRAAREALATAEEAGERRGLERAAADYERRADELCAEADADDAADRPEFATSARERASVLRVLALELRALGRPA